MIKNKIKLILLSPVFIVLFYIVSGCVKDKDKVVIGLIPWESREIQQKKADNLSAYLEKAMGREVRIYIADDYKQIISDISTGSIDIAMFGAFSYIIAASRKKMVPLVVRERKKLGIYYNSLIVSRKKSSIKRIEDLKNKKFAFVNSASTSGYMIPLSLFVSRNLRIEKYFSSHYFAGSHDHVLRDVLSGKAEAGAISNTIIKKMINKKSEGIKKIRIMWKSEGIPGSLFAARSDLNRDCRESFLKAMLNFHKKDPAMLHKFDSTVEKYIICNDEMYNGIRNIASILGKEYIEKNFL